MGTMRILTILVVLFLGMGETVAEEAYAEPGFYAGVSIGRGSIGIDCDNCYGVPDITEALSLTGSIGYRLNSQIGIVGEYWRVTHNDFGTDWFDDEAPHQITQNMATLALQVWVIKNVWLKAGAGTGWHISDSPYATVPVDDRIRFAQGLSNETSTRATLPRPRDSVSGEPSRAVFAAIGWEFLKSEHISIDVQLRVGKTIRPEYQFQIYNTAFNIGFTLR